ncbi:MAG: DUF1249 domain-containing protein [Acidobacteriota bacterium]
MKKLVYQKIYDRLDKLLPGGCEEFCSKDDNYVKFKSDGFMDLNVDVQNWKEETANGKRISMAHNFVQNGDLMADPDMEIRIFTKEKAAEALTFQMDTMGLYQEVYPEPGKQNTGLKKKLNTFLLQWLVNIESQGFQAQKRTKKEVS